MFLDYTSKHRLLSPKDFYRSPVTPVSYTHLVLRSAGVIDALVKAGASEGDTVSLYDLEFDFVE